MVTVCPGFPTPVVSGIGAAAKAAARTTIPRTVASLFVKAASEPDTVVSSFAS